jgi:hypothetical protein
MDEGLTRSTDSSRICTLEQFLDSRRNVAVLDLLTGIIRVLRKGRKLSCLDDCADSGSCRYIVNVERADL